jgi:hypothetical protein
VPRKPRNVDKIIEGKLGTTTDGLPHDQPFVKEDKQRWGRSFRRGCENLRIFVSFCFVTGEDWKTPTDLQQMFGRRSANRSWIRRNTVGCC